MLYTPPSCCSELIGAFAARAVCEEILTAPKPGLVDPLHQGSHRDMSWVTFIKSACALAPHWRRQAALGALRLDDDTTSATLRQQGLEMESAMFEATDGVNTHKGLIFALSLLVAATGSLAGGGESGAAVCAKAGAIAGPLCLPDMERILARGPHSGNSNGERIFLEHGLRGIRGEALEGFPAIRNHGLPAFSSALARGARRNDAALAALLAIMSSCCDTNIIHRAGHDFWSGEYKSRVKETVQAFDPAEPDYSAIHELDALLLSKRASPGGAADLLACTLFLSRSKITDNMK